MKIEHDTSANLVLINAYGERIRGVIICRIMGIVIYLVLESLFAM